MEQLYISRKSRGVTRGEVFNSKLKPYDALNNRFGSFTI